MKDSTRKILIIEDHPEQAKLMTALLHKFDKSLDVHSVGSAEKGLDELNMNSYHAIVLDYELPGINGIDFLKLLKKMDNPPPVVMVTARGDEQVASQAIRYGAYDYIVKTPEHLDTLPRTISRAINEHKLVNQLEQSEQRFSELFENACISIFIIDAESYEIYQTNNMAMLLTEYTERELLRRNFCDLFSPQQIDKAFDTLRDMRKNEQGHCEQIVITSANNKAIPIEIHGSLVKTGTSTVLQLFISDISEKLRMQRQLLLSRQRLVSLFDGITDLISVFNQDYKLLLGNKKFLEYTHNTPKSITGQKCFTALFNRTKPCEKCPAVKTRKSGETNRTEVYVDGKTFDVWTFPMAGIDGRPEYIVEYVREITDQKAIESQLIKSEKLATLGLLSSGIAHELRNPLNIIETARYALGDLIEEKDDNIQHKLDMIKKNVTRASSVINNLLHFSRHSEFQKERIDISRLIKDTVLLLKKEIELRKIECQFNISSIPTVFFNIDSLKQVFLNIIFNAVQAMPKGGILEVFVPQPDDEQWLTLYFRDTGSGIADEHLQHIFEPFFSTKSPNQGTGLGLYITYNILKQEGGDINVESKLGRGTTFIIKLPIAGQDDRPIG